MIQHLYGNRLRLEALSLDNDDGFSWPLPFLRKRIKRNVFACIINNELYLISYRVEAHLGPGRRSSDFSYYGHAKAAVLCLHQEFTMKCTKNSSETVLGGCYSICYTDFYVTILARPAADGETRAMSISVTCLGGPCRSALEDKWRIFEDSQLHELRLDRSLGSAWNAYATNIDSDSDGLLSNRKVLVKQP